MLVYLTLGRGPLTLSQGDRSEGRCVCKKGHMRRQEVREWRPRHSLFSFAGSKPASLRAVLTLPMAMT